MITSSRACFQISTLPLHRNILHQNKASEYRIIDSEVGDGHRS
jgi:hypothetical protein